jgi:BlaI family transcriptional regulator, penicillinase repressor
MVDAKKNMSPTEWRLMKILWSLGSAAARDVYQIAEERYGITKGTTKNLLSRLVEKGHLATQQIGNSYLYKPASPMLDCICEAADELLEHTPEEVADALTLQLVKQGNLSGEGIKQLRKLLDEY